MAYAALLSSVEILAQITQKDQYQILFPNKKPIETLHENFTFLLAFLEDDHPSRVGKIADHVESQMREVAYQALDIIEFHVSDQMSPNKECLDRPRPRVKKSYWKLLSNVQKVITLRSQRGRDADLGVVSFEKVSRDLQKVAEEVDFIVKEVIKIKESQIVEDFKVSSFPRDVGSHPRIQKGTMVGFDDHLLEIKGQLCGGSSKLQIIPIVGMGGIGKTTLASNVYHDPLITYHFHSRAWVTITQHHNVREILRGLLSLMTTVITKKISPEETEEDLAECLYKSLKGRKYLIVLDDIWTTEVWDDVKMLFPDDHNGSRIMLTTRLVDLAVYVNSCGPCHRIQFLSEDQSWDLLREKVFEEECCPSELEEIGKLIARNCRGLPLSIVVVAGLLSRGNRIKSHWENIARGVSSVVTENGEHFVSNILSLSYNHLPHRLKACFLYIGGFPEDYEVPVFKLIRMWIAEGFVKPMGSKSLEDVGEEYLEDLVKRSLVLVTKKRLNGKFKFCSIHDLLRDLCIQKARDENFLHTIDGIQERVDNKRRLCFAKSMEWYHFRNNNAGTTSSSVRCIFCFLYNGSFLTSFSLLRVLDILEHNFYSFPVEILNLFHLRYLAFTSGFNPHFKLPPSMPKLQNLQTLIIGSSLRLRTNDDPIVVAPLPIWKMPQLRHLVFLNISLSPFPFPFGNGEEFLVLENLQTLSRVRNFRFTNTRIEMIPNLRKLKVLYSGESHRQRSEYDLDNLVHLHKLETLNLKFLPSVDWWRNPLPVSFGVPLALKKLTLSGCGLSWKEMGINIGSLPNLEVLKLRSLSVMGSEWEPLEGEFTQLKFLLMEWLDLKNWVAEDSHFPRFEHLVIKHCSGLECIPSEIGEIPTLQVIEVDDSKRAAYSAKLILEEQRNLGNDVLQIRVGSDWL